MHGRKKLKYFYFQIDRHCIDLYLFIIIYNILFITLMKIRAKNSWKLIMKSVYKLMKKFEIKATHF